MMGRCMRTLHYFPNFFVVFYVFFCFLQEKSMVVPVKEDLYDVEF
jgi:hypothetical protein